VSWANVEFVQMINPKRNVANFINCFINANLDYNGRQSMAGNVGALRSAGHLENVQPGTKAE
jgi:hypothetical protein